MTEHELTLAVLDRAAKAGVLAHHCPNSKRCLGQPGLPDLILLGRRGLVVAELKSAEGDTSAEQDLWLWTVSYLADDWEGTAEYGPPIRYAVWRPAQLEDGTIDDMLRLIR